MKQYLRSEAEVSSEEIMNQSDELIKEALQIVQFDEFDYKTPYDEEDDDDEEFMIPLGDLELIGSGYVEEIFDPINGFYQKKIVMEQPGYQQVTIMTNGPPPIMMGMAGPRMQAPVSDEDIQGGDEETVASNPDQNQQQMIDDGFLGLITGIMQGIQLQRAIFLNALMNDMFASNSTTNNTNYPIMPYQGDGSFLSQDDKSKEKGGEEHDDQLEETLLLNRYERIMIAVSVVILIVVSTIIFWIHKMLKDSPQKQTLNTTKYQQEPETVSLTVNQNDTYMKRGLRKND